MKVALPDLRLGFPAAHWMSQEDLRRTILAMA
jgi:hypothetical protein